MSTVRKPASRRKAKTAPVPKAVAPQPQGRKATYSEVKNGDYFLTISSQERKVAFLQTDDDRNFAKYMTQGPGPDGRERCLVGSRPRPTRLWDAAFHGLDENQPVEIVSRDVAVECARAMRALYR